MAVETASPKLVKDLLPKVRRTTATLAITFQVLSLAATAAVLFALGMFERDLIGAGIILGAQLLIGMIFFPLIIAAIIRPLSTILSALVHVSGEPTNAKMPNPNDRDNVKSGMKVVLQTIYGLSSGRTPEANETPDTLLVEANENSEPLTSSAQKKNDIEDALDNTLCGFVSFDSNRTVTYANRAAPIAVNTEGVRSLNVYFNQGESLLDWWDEMDDNKVHAEKTWTRISDKLPNEENRRLFDIIATYEKGAKSEVVLTLVDRTSAYSTDEEALDFIAFAAHELRGPITVIRGYLDVLQSELNDTLEADQKELFKRLDVSASKLSGYINNILNTSRYDRRHLRIHPVETTMASVYGSIKDDMELRATSQNRLLQVAIPEDLPTIGADTASLGEVFGNLIDNAIKYSNEGGLIEVTAGAKGDTVEFSVTDHGIGMPGNVVGNLFQKFYRSHRSRETVAGTGIGLYISKAIVESHGGTISVRSEDGRGSSFTISLPTYKMIADKLKEGDNGNESLISQNGSWINNHTMYRG